MQVTARPELEIEAWIKENRVILHGKNIPRPCFSFNELGFPIEVLAKLNGRFIKPTVIQCISWPVALCGRDLVSVAQTGSGKTLAVIIN